MLDMGVLRYYRSPDEAAACPPIRDAHIVVPAYNIVAAGTQLSLAPATSASKRTWELAGESTSTTLQWDKALRAHGASG